MVGTFSSVKILLFLALTYEKNNQPLANVTGPREESKGLGQRD